jgi:hypothetical protein
MVHVGIMGRFVAPPGRPKAAAITPVPVIEKMVLPPGGLRFNLQLRVHSRIQPGNQPRKIWKQSLAFTALETIHLFFANPDGMSINARRQPRSVQLPGVFLLGDRLFQISH